MNAHLKHLTNELVTFVEKNSIAGAKPLILTKTFEQKLEVQNAINKVIILRFDDFLYGQKKYELLTLDEWVYKFIFMFPERCKSTDDSVPFYKKALTGLIDEDLNKLVTDTYPVVLCYPHNSLSKEENKIIEAIKL